MCGEFGRVPAKRSTCHPDKQQMQWLKYVFRYMVQVSWFTEAIPEGWYRHRHLRNHLLLLFCSPSSTSFAYSGTRSWSAFPSDKERALFRSAFALSSTCWSEILSLAPASGTGCRFADLVSSLKENTKLIIE